MVEEKLNYASMLNYVKWLRFNLAEHCIDLGDDDFVVDKIYNKNNSLIIKYKIRQKLPQYLSISFDDDKIFFEDTDNVIPETFNDFLNKNKDDIINLIITMSKIEHCVRTRVSNFLRAQIMYLSNDDNDTHIDYLRNYFYCKIKLGIGRNDGLLDIQTDYVPLIINLNDSNPISTLESSDAMDYTNAIKYIIRSYLYDSLFDYITTMEG